VHDERAVRSVHDEFNGLAFHDANLGAPA
jgi:hypothetical protein